METIQYNAALAIAGAITGSSRKKPYQELGLRLFKSDGGIENFAVSTKY